MELKQHIGYEASKRLSLIYPYSRKIADFIRFNTAFACRKLLHSQYTLPSIMASIFPSLKGLLDIIKSHIGFGLIDEPEPLLTNLISRFNSILGITNGEKIDNTIEAAKREKSTDWGLLLKDTVDYLLSNKGLIQDGKSQALRIDDDIGVLIDLAHTKVADEGLNDKSYLVGISI
jgi:hypothetical protein